MKRFCCMVFFLLLFCNTAALSEEETFSLLSILEMPGLVYLHSNEFALVERDRLLIKGVSPEEVDAKLGKHISRKTDRYYYAWTHFRDKYPYMDIEHVIQTGAMSQLITSLMAGDQNLDIISQVFFDLSDLYEKGLLVDIAAYSPMLDVLDDWPDISHLFGDGEHLFAIPEKMNPQLVEVLMPSIIMELAMEIDTSNWSWDTFFDIGNMLSDYNEKHGTNICLLKPDTYTPFWLSQYVINECHENRQEQLDVDALRSLLSRWKNAIDKGIIEILNPRDPKWSTMRKQNVLYSMNVEYYSHLEARALVMPPTYRDGIRPTEVNTLYYFVNPSSPHVQESLDYLTFFSSSEALTASASYIYYSNGIFPESADVEWPEGYDYVTGKYIDPPSPENHDLFQRALETGFRHSVPEILINIIEIFDAYMAEKIGLEECVQTMISRMEMFLGE